MVKVSILIPCLNEEKNIGQTLESLCDDYVKTYGEILVIDGKSTDNTIGVVQTYIDKNFPVRLLINEKRLQCFGLNQGIDAAQGDIIVRGDAHSSYPPFYVKNLVSLLEETKADNVGGMMLPRGKTTIQNAIAMAMLHPVGVGNARFHLGNFKGEVDTVYLGTFHKNIFNKIGYYDTNCRTNEDAELNIRIRKAGGKIFLDSSIQVEYQPRTSLKKLAKQYFHYGKGRAYTTVKHKQFTSLRQLAPPLLVISLFCSLGLGFLSPLSWLVWPAYLFLVFMAAFLFPPSGKPKIPGKTRLVMAMAFITMHISWGLGFVAFFVLPRPGGGF